MKYLFTIAALTCYLFATTQTNIHESFNSLLQKNVSTDGKVNYSAIKKNSTTLNTYLTQLAKQTPAANWTKNAALAYWINAYNAFTIKLIIDNYPTKSITQLSGGKPWDVKFIELAEKKYSLNQIENEIIRPQYKDARIHFALNCGARSCPPLLNIAFTENNIDELLTKRTKQFLQNSSANEIAENNLCLSKIFDWYKADFGNIPSFITKYMGTKISPNVTIEYKEYNWSLNDK